MSASCKLPSSSSTTANMTTRFSSLVTKTFGSRFSYAASCFIFVRGLQLLFWFLEYMRFLMLIIIATSGLYLYGSLSFCTTICFVNHWRKAEDGIRRKTDKAAAWIAFIAYVVTGFVCLPIYLSFVTVGIIVSSFFVSDHLSQRHHPFWFLTHMFFHFSVSVTKCFIINDIITNSCSA